MSHSFATLSASLALGSPICQPCSSRPRLPRGSSRLWSGPATKPSSDIDMWQVVSGTANLLGDCDLLAVVQTVAGDGKPYLLHTGSPRPRSSSSRSRPLAGQGTSSSPADGCFAQYRSLMSMERARTLPIRGQGFPTSNSNLSAPVRPASFRPGKRTSATEEVCDVRSSFRAAGSPG